MQNKIFAIIFFFFFSSVSFAQVNDDSAPENVGVRVQGAPVVKYSSDYGASFGGHLSIYDYGNGSVLPFKYNYRVQAMLGTHGDYSANFNFEAPQIFDSKFRVQTSASLSRVLDYNYFGIGNNTPDVPTSAFYKFERLTPSFMLTVFRPIFGKFHGVLGYSFDKRIVKKDPNSKLAIDAPRGSDGGIDSELRFGISYDSRDNEAMPNKGIFADAFAELPVQWLGSTYNYARFTLTGRSFLTILPRTVWANRIVLKNSVGTVPFYEMASIGGFTHYDGLGGNNTLRGFRQTRFIDRSMIFFNEEIRLRTFNFYIKKERFDIYVLAFADFGRVFNSMKNFSLAEMHLAGGGGLRLCWNKNFIISPDIGFSKEGYSIYFSFKNIF